MDNFPTKKGAQEACENAERQARTKEDEWAVAPLKCAGARDKEKLQSSILISNEDEEYKECEECDTFHKVFNS